MIKRGDRMYLQISAIGECNADGKSVLRIGYRNKVVAEPDRPLSMLVVGLINEIAVFAGYSSADAARADVQALADYVADLNEKISSSASNPPPHWKSK